MNQTSQLQGVILFTILLIYNLQLHTIYFEPFGFIVSTDYFYEIFNIGYNICCLQYVSQQH